MGELNDARKKKLLSAVFNLSIFAAFISGLVTMHIHPPEGLQGPGNLKLLLAVYSLILNLSFVAAFSVFGLLLMPILAFSFGLMSYKVSELLLGALSQGIRGLLPVLTILIIIFPVFFLVTAEGMETSLALINSLNSQSMTYRLEYKRKYIPMCIALTIWSAAMYLIIGEIYN